MSTNLGNGSPVLHTSPSSLQQHKLKYKNNGLDANEMRRRREEEGVQIRKQKREQNLFKRRNLGSNDLDQESGESSRSGGTDTEQHVSEEMIQGLYSSSFDIKLTSVRRFRMFLSKNPGTKLDEVVNAGVVPRLVELLIGCEQDLGVTGESDVHQHLDRVNLTDSMMCNLQYESAWTLTNITSGSSAHTRAVVDGGAVPLLSKLLHSVNVPVQEQSIWTLANIAGDSTFFRDVVISHNVLAQLLRVIATSIMAYPAIIEKGKVKEFLGRCRSLVSHGLWCLSNLCRGKTPPVHFMVVSPVYPFLAQVLTCYKEQPKDVNLLLVNDEMLADICTTLSFLSDGPYDKIQAVIDAGLHRPLIELLMHSNRSIVAPTLRTLGNLVTGNDIQTQCVLDAGLLHSLKFILTNDKLSDEKIYKEACWTISNITAGKMSQIQSVIDFDLIPIFIQIMATAQFNTRKEAAYALVNIALGGSHDQIKLIVGHGCIPHICQLLSVSEPKLIELCLSGLLHILKSGTISNAEEERNIYAHIIEECDGLTKIERLSTAHTNGDISRKASQIVDNYFSDDGIETEMNRVGLEQEAATTSTRKEYSFTSLLTTKPLTAADFENQRVGGNDMATYNF